PFPYCRGAELSAQFRNGRLAPVAAHIVDLEDRRLSALRARKVRWLVDVEHQLHGIGRGLIHAPDPLSVEMKVDAVRPPVGAIDMPVRGVERQQRLEEGLFEPRIVDPLDAVPKPRAL